MLRHIRGGKVGEHPVDDDVAQTLHIVQQLLQLLARLDADAVHAGFDFQVGLDKGQAPLPGFIAEQLRVPFQEQRDLDAPLHRMGNGVGGDRPQDHDLTVRAPGVLDLSRLKQAGYRQKPDPALAHQIIGHRGGAKAVCVALDHREHGQTAGVPLYLVKIGPELIQVNVQPAVIVCNIHLISPPSLCVPCRRDYFCSSSANSFTLRRPSRMFSSEVA